MAGGSKERESARDQQCCHCGRFYSDRGIKGHEDNCEFCDYDVVLVPLEDSEESTLAPTSEDTPAPIEDTPAPTDGTPEQGAAPSEAVTDGGTGLGLSGPPSTPTESEDDVEDDQGDEEETEDCPRCGEDLGATEEEIRAARKPCCSECGTRLQVT